MVPSKISPVVFWLLLTATLAVDAVALSLILVQQLPGAAAGALYDALCFGQLSVVSIWAVFGARHRTRATALVIGAALIVAAITARLLDFHLWTTLGVYGGYAAVLTFVLWVVKQTRLWSGNRAPRQAGPWQFSLAQLLGLMTVVALLSAALRYDEVTQQNSFRTTIVVAVATHSATAVAALLCWIQPWHLLFRAAATFALAGAAAWAVKLSAAPNLAFAIERNLLGAMLILIWLEIGQIIPRGAPADAPIVRAPTREG